MTKDTKCQNMIIHTIINLKMRVNNVSTRQLSNMKNKSDVVIHQSNKLILITTVIKLNHITV